MESYAIARFARIAPRKARTVVNLVRGRKVSEAINLLMFTRKSAAPIVRKVIESALANARKKEPTVDIDGLYVSIGQVDQGPNKHLRRWRPRAMGRATRVTEPFGVTLNMDYDKVGNRTSVIDSLGNTETSTYDNANYLTTRTFAGQGSELRVKFTNNKEGWNTTQIRYSDVAGTTPIGTSVYSFDNAARIDA